MLKALPDGAAGRAPVFGDDALVVVECDRVARRWTHGGLTRWTDVPIANPEIELAKPGIVSARKDHRLESIARGFPRRLSVE